MVPQMENISPGRNQAAYLRRRKPVVETGSTVIVSRQVKIITGIRKHRGGAITPCVIAVHTATYRARGERSKHQTYCQVPSNAGGVTINPPGTCVTPWSGKPDLSQCLQPQIKLRGINLCLNLNWTRASDGVTWFRVLHRPRRFCGDGQAPDAAPRKGNSRRFRVFGTGLRLGRCQHAARESENQKNIAQVAKWHGNRAHRGPPSSSFVTFFAVWFPDHSSNRSDGGWDLGTGSLGQLTDQKPGSLPPGSGARGQTTLVAGGCQTSPGDGVLSGVRSRFFRIEPGQSALRWLGPAGH